MIELLAENPYLQTAAVVANKFSIDPVLVLKGNSGDGSYFDYAIRAAAANYVSGLEVEAQRQSDARNKNQTPQVPHWVG